MESQDIDVATLLHRCGQVEATMARVYRALAEAHAHDPEIAALWHKTANEEDNHGKQFQLALNLRKDTAPQVRVEATRVEEALRAARRFLADIQANRPGVEEALSWAITMEQDMVDLHVNSVARFQSDAHRKLFAAMMATDKAHVESLRVALARRRAGAR